VTTAQRSFTVATRGRGSYDITGEVQTAVNRAGVVTGLCHVFVHHTSASLLLTENADPQVRADLDAFMGRMVPDGDPRYGHDAEGPDDMAAHIRTVLTGAELTLPVTQARCALGTWQGVYLWEHRSAAHTRRITVTITGEADPSLEP
jgi:secondary thiamine-phosphate synthase enzyme